jgi:hypothetical protein
MDKNKEPVLALSSYFLVKFNFLLSPVLLLLDHLDESSSVAALQYPPRLKSSVLGLLRRNNVVNCLLF